MYLVEWTHGQFTSALINVWSQAGVSELLEKVDADRSGDLSLGEFKALFEVARLRRVFEALDADGSGLITGAEMVNALKLLGVRATQKEAASLIDAIDRNHDDQISWEEFHEAFKLVPLASLHAVAAKWSSLSQLDIGSDLSPLLPNPDLKIWQTVFAGGCAGVAGRTLTAPLERVKLAAQTGNLQGSMITGIRKIYVQEGVRGLFRGNFANCLRVFPTGGLTLTTYLGLLNLTPADNEVARAPRALPTHLILKTPQLLSRLIIRAQHPRLCSHTRVRRTRHRPVLFTSPPLKSTHMYALSLRPQTRIDGRHGALLSRALCWHCVGHRKHCHIPLGPCSRPNDPPHFSCATARRSPLQPPPPVLPHHLQV
jgi:hypothetical protein